MAEKRSYVKRFTHNFIDTSMSEAEWNTWKDKNPNIPVYFDRRNNIYCINPTMDYEMYYNYIKYLNLNRDAWTNQGYLDMGMLPFIMWPSFMEHADVYQQMKRIASHAGINIVSVPAVSFLKESYNQVAKDYWIYRDDLIKFMEFMSQTSGAYNFKDCTVDTVSLLTLLEPLATISRSARGD